MTIIKRFAVVGNPINHSLSPFIHDAFGRQLKITLQYDRILSSINDFADVIRSFFDGGGSGLNITVPFKEKAFSLMHNLTPRASRAFAVNTIYLDEKMRLCGDNTDGIGLRRDLEKNLAITLARKNILLFGAGGAARGVLGDLLEAAPNGITIANRTPEKAINLAQQFKLLADTHNVDLNAGGIDLATKCPYDLVINATSRGLSREAPNDFKVLKDGLVYDLLYGEHSKPLLELGKQKGADVVDGLGMLVEQAAEAFCCWHNVYPDTVQVLQLLRSERAQ